MIALLRSLSYIRQDLSNGELFSPYGSSHCYLADWQSLADLRGEGGAGLVDMSSFGETLKVTTEGALDNIPAQVIGLTCGNRMEPSFSGRG